jgi:hypothetical protein
MSDWHPVTSYGAERRAAEEREASPNLPVSLDPPNRVSCFKCGLPVDISRVYGGDWYFEPNGTSIHKCRYRRPRR